MDIPKPKQKMRTFNWNKLAPNKILGKRNIWSLVAKNNEEKKGKAKAKKAKLINFEDMEHLFCQQAPAPPGGQPKDDNKVRFPVRFEQVESFFRLKSHFLTHFYDLIHDNSCLI